VFALDLDGFGYTHRTAPYTTSHLAEQLLGFLDALHLGGAGQRPLLVGHSSGAAIAADAVLLTPGRIGGVLFLDGDALDTGAGPPAVARFLLVDPYRTSLLRLGVRSDRLIRAIYSRQCGPACPKLDRAGVGTWRRPFQVAGAEKAVWAMAKARIIGLPARRVGEVRATGVPAAVVFGEKDDVFSARTPAETAERIGAPPPTLIPGGRHLTMISHPAQVAAAVESLAARARQRAARAAH
jgi:pimeloyl-ACP methyl ester carboxylesterase